MNSTSRRWTIPLLGMGILIAGAVVWKGTRPEGESYQARLTKVLLACEAHMRAQHDGVIRVDVSGGDVVRTVILRNQVQWTIDGLMYRDDVRNAFECDAAESRQGIEVTHTNSPFWWTPTP